MIPTGLSMHHAFNLLGVLFLVLPLLVALFCGFVALAATLIYLAIRRIRHIAMTGSA